MVAPEDGDRYERAQRAGADFVLAEPVDVDELRTAVCLAA